MTATNGCFDDLYRDFRRLKHAIREFHEHAEELAADAAVIEADADALWDRLAKEPPDGGPPMWHRRIEDVPHLRELADLMGEGTPSATTEVATAAAQ